MYNDSKQPSALSSQPGWSIFNTNNKRLVVEEDVAISFNPWFTTPCNDFLFSYWNEKSRGRNHFYCRTAQFQTMLLFSQTFSLAFLLNASLCQMTSVSLWFVILHHATVHLTVLHVVREIRQWCWRTFVVDCKSCGAHRSWLASFLCEPRWAITARYVDVEWRSISPWKQVWLIAPDSCLFPEGQLEKQQQQQQEQQEQQQQQQEQQEQQQQWIKQFLTYTTRVCTRTRMHTHMHPQWKWPFSQTWVVDLFPLAKKV